MSTCFNAATLSRDNDTISTCHYPASKLNRQINILFLFSPSWCLSPSVLVWHILPHCPLEHCKSSYLLLQIWPMFFPSSFSSFVIHLLLRNPTFPRWSHSKHPSLTLKFPGTKESFIISEFPFSVLPNSSSYYFIWWTTFSSSLEITTCLFALHSVFFTLANTLSEAFSTQEIAQPGHLRLC